MQGSLGRAGSMFMWTFVVSALINITSDAAATKLNIYISAVILLVIILIGVFFDVIGTAATASTEPSLNAMAAKRIFGATQALWLIQRADSVANFCNDFVGDICGTVSGAVGATLIIKIISLYELKDAMIVSACGVAVVSALTVGAKAMGKTLAMESCDKIMLGVGKIVGFFEKVTHLNITKSGKRKKN